MISALLGLASALGLGVADFMARFSARALGAPLTYGAVLLIGALGATVLVLAVDVPLVLSPVGCAIAIVHGMSVAVMCILLYMALARGPIAVVAPIVAAHPALVLIVNVLRGTRPSAVQWAAMFIIILGGILITRTAVADESAADAEGDQTTLIIAFGACLAYAFLILTGQAAAPLIGELETMWIGRWSGLIVIAAVLLLQRRPLSFPAKWIPYVGVQGVLDAAGYLALLAGGVTAAPYITMVVASGFSVVTVLLARLIIREPVSRTQWAAIGMIAGGAAILSGT
jgi:drug/metabolite transporter (DMT)-like permease